MDWEEENITIRLQPASPQLIDINSCQLEAGPIQSTNPKIEKTTIFGPRLDAEFHKFWF